MIIMSNDSIRAIAWRDETLVLLDQRYLPQQETDFVCNKLSDVIDAIRLMVVRGAPAIGITAAFGVVISARDCFHQHGDQWKQFINADLKLLAAARPTAVNLAWAIEQMNGLVQECSSADPCDILLQKAQDMLLEDIQVNKAMGASGADLIERDSQVLTHCNAGALATAGFGTALGVIRSAFEAGKIKHVYADETRPWLQGARLTAWELVKEKIPVSLIVDSAAAHLMKQGDISWVIVGSDRIAANGDVANKIGTYSVAIAARYHGVKFMVVAPTSTIDMSLATGDLIPIEERSPDEMMQIEGHYFAAKGSNAWNPVFDITPADLVDAIVTEKGVIMQPNADKIRKLMSR
ncbi:MAG: S-methyl-5-thioribose-1-phosphate isomerase [Gammaproteobacteria bacterium]|nr:S-methyl-5-thioribose-1-phosphate isomerase [Gammaproteobacteria bacterium]